MPTHGTKTDPAEVMQSLVVPIAPKIQRQPRTWQVPFRVASCHNDAYVYAQSARSLEHNLSLLNRLR
jgi:hypothetical protein